MARKKPTKQRARESKWGYPLGPVLGEVRYHRKNGLMYIYEFLDSRLAWIRYDTWVWGRWQDFPHRTAKERDLRKFDREGLHLNPKKPYTLVRIGFE